jgi:iron complex outermembrane recepter protein
MRGFVGTAGVLCLLPGSAAALLAILMTGPVSAQRQSQEPQSPSQQQPAHPEQPAAAPPSQTQQSNVRLSTIRVRSPRRAPARTRQAGPPRTAQPAPAPPRETAYGPVQGYVANQSATGTKTDTPIRETPQSISVITRDQMQAQGVQNLAQALRYTAGVTGELFGLDTRCYGVQMRGFNTWAQAFYKDGLQLRAPSFANFLCLDPYGAERIEVLRGPASVLYGQNDPGGIVNYVTKRPPTTPFREIEFQAGSFNDLAGKFDIGGPANKEKTLLYRLTGVVRDADTQVDLVGLKRTFFAPALTWMPTPDTTLTLLSHYQRENTGWGLQFLPAVGTIYANPNGRIPTNRFTGEPSWDHYKNTTLTTGYLFEHRVDDIWTVRQNARYAHLENDQKGVFGLGFADATQRTLVRYGDYGRSKLDSFTIDNQIQGKFATGPLRHTLLVGLDYQHHRFSDLGGGTDPLFLPPLDLFNPTYGLTALVEDPNGIYQNSTQKQGQTGLYIQDQIKLDRWVLTLGGRQDWVSTTTDSHGTAAEPIPTTRINKDRAFTGRVGLGYLFDNGMTPYASYSTSFLPVLGTNNAASVAFAPETAEQYEVGLKYQPTGWNAFITVAAFDITRQNTLTNDPANLNLQIQRGEVRSRGVEVEAVASILGLDLRAAYTYLDMEFTKDTLLQGNTPYGVSRNRASLWADRTIKGGPLDGFGFGAGVRYVGSSWGDDANTFRLPNVTLADAAIHYERGSYRFSVNAQNLFDTIYVSTCSTPAGCYYGLRRAVIGTVRYRW